MNVDALLKDLAAERVGDLLPLLRRAYELGFREGMASTGQPMPAPAWTEPAEESGSGDSQPSSSVGATDGGFSGSGPSSSTSAATDPAGRTDESVDEDDDDDADNGPEKPVYPGVRASSTIGGVLKKIERVFRLEERFELVVRIENPRSGRALPRHVRLSSYLRHD